MNGILYFERTKAVLRIECSETAVLRIERVETAGESRPNELCRKAAGELEEYFSGKRRAFDLPVCPEGTEFQKKVWEALAAIPYGETRSYGEIAEALGGKRFSRAVGAANRKNPILILIPCHRVVGADGALTGFAAGLDLKAALLALEKRGSEETSRQPQ